MARTSPSGMFSGSSNVVITGGHFNYTHDSPSCALSDGWACFSSSIDPGAFHDSMNQGEGPKSPARQYEELLGQAMDWVRDPEVTERILWVHGSPCTSTISRNVANFRRDDSLRVATYFFSRNADSLDALARLVPTITYQLCRFFPTVRPEIGNIVAQDPIILSLSVGRQLRALILEPLAPFLYVPEGAPYTSPNPVLIIVHGCDYLDNYTQNCIVNALLLILQEFPLSVRILLSTNSSAMITSLTPSIEDGLVKEIAFSEKRSLRSIINKIWNRFKNVHIRNQT